MLLDDVRAALEESAHLVGAGSAEPRTVLTRARRTVRRRRVTQAAIVAAVVVVVAGGIVIAVTHRSSTADRIVVAAPTTTITTPTPTTGAAPPGGMTAEQLDAHLGVGAPAGWVPVDWGDARIFVPKEWLLEAPGSCLKEANATGAVTIGPPACDAGFGPGTQAISVSSTTAKDPPAGTSVQIVHGYRVYWSPDRYGLVATAYFVPELGVTLSMRGSLQDKVLGTLAPSARKVAFASDLVAPGHSVTGDGVRVTIPATWTVATPDFLPCRWPGTNGPPELVRITPRTGATPCPGPVPLVIAAVHDGLYVYTEASSFAPRPDTSPIAVLHHGPTTIRVYIDASDLNLLDVSAQRAGSSTAHMFGLGLGLDGRVAGSVLASIEATS